MPLILINSIHPSIILFIGIKDMNKQYFLGNNKYDIVYKPTTKSHLTEQIKNENSFFILLRQYISKAAL